MPSPPPPPVPMSPWLLLSRVHKVGEVPEGAAFLLAAVAPPRVSWLTLSPATLLGGGASYIVAADDCGRRLLVVVGGPSSASRLPTLLRDEDAASHPLNSRSTSTATSSSPPPTDGDCYSTQIILRPPTASALYKFLICDLYTDALLWVLVPDELDISEDDNIALIGAPSGDEFLIAQILLNAAFAENTAGATCTLLRYWSNTAEWTTTMLVHPQVTRPRSIDSVFSHGGRLWWVDFSWGVFSIDPFLLHPVVEFAPFPVVYTTEEDSTDQWENSRWVGFSKNNLIYVVLVHEPYLGHAVKTWSMNNAQTGQWRWELTVSLEGIWSDPSYSASGLPVSKPMVAFIDPLQPDVLYFALDHNIIFSANLRDSEIKNCSFNSFTPQLLIAWPLPQVSSLLTVEVPRHGMLDIVWQSVGSLLSIGQDGEAAFNLGVQLCNLGANLTQLNHHLDQATQYINQVLPYLEMFCEMFGDTPTSTLVRNCIQVLKYLSRYMGTTGGALGFGAWALTQMGQLLQDRYRFAQTGGRQGLTLRQIVTVRNVEEADAVIREWNRTGELVVAEVERNLPNEEAQLICNRFLRARAYDLIMDSSVLQSKMQSADESEWLVA